jgi:hypothetical protein
MPAMLLPFLPQPLIDDIAYRRCVPFIGAGFSKNARSDVALPDWKELGQMLIARMDEQAVAIDDPAATALEYEKMYGRPELITTVCDAIDLTGAYLFTV